MFSIKVRVTAFFLSFIVLFLGNGVLLTSIISDKTSQERKNALRNQTSIQTTVFAQENPEDATLPDIQSQPQEDGYPLENPLEGTINTSFEADEEKVSLDSVSSAEDEDGSFPPGFYAIGEDMPAGIYKLTAFESQAAFYRISDNIKEEYYNITDNDVFNTFTYILVRDGEYLNLIDASADPLEKAQSSSPIQLSYSNGKYLSGKDIPSGIYNVIPDGKSGYVEIAASPVRSLSDIIFSRIIHESIQVTLLDGQYIKLSSARIEPVK